MAEEAREYYYYDYHDGYIGREEVGNRAFPCNRFEFYLNGEWINDVPLSLGLSDATMDVDGYSIFDYREITEAEALRRIASGEHK